MSTTTESKYAEWTLTECEAGVHEDGPCTEECVQAAYQMDGSGGYESMVYSDYLGGTSSVDVSGCHRGPSMPEQRYRLDGGKVVGFYVHPEDCDCGTYECPVQVEERAYVATASYWPTTRRDGTPVTVYAYPDGTAVESTTQPPTGPYGPVLASRGRML